MEVTFAKDHSAILKDLLHYLGLIDFIYSSNKKRELTTLISSLGDP